MRILYIVTAPQTTGFLRGNLAYLKSRGFQPLVCSSPGKQLHETAESDGVDFVEVPMSREMSPLKDIISLWRLFRLIWKLRPTIVIAGTPKAVLLATLAARSAGVPVKICIFWGTRVEVTTGWLRRILWWTSKLPASLATRILCDSESGRQKIVELKIAPLPKIHVLAHGSSNGVNLKRFNINSGLLSEAALLKNKYHISKDVSILGFIGRIKNDKGINELVETFRIILNVKSNISLFVIGPEDIVDSVPKENLNWLKSHPKIIVTGSIKNVVSYYNLFDVLVFPSYKEGFPNVVMEAAAMGVPTVGFNATGVVDAVVDGETGTIVPMKDCNAMANAVLRYLNDTDLKAQHGLNGRKRVVHDFQPSMLWEAYYQEYCDLLKKKNIPIPQPETPPEPLLLVDPDEDKREFRKWYAVREIFLRGKNIEDVCQQLNININEVNEAVKLC